MKSKLLVAAAAACAACACGAVDLVRGNTDVVIAKNAPDPVLWAAEEATNFLSRVFGEPVPVVNEPRNGRTALILGVNKWTKAAGIDPEKHPRDTYFIKTAGDAVLVCGADDRVSVHRRLTGPGTLEDFQRATSFGLYGFLERFAGCRFYFPGELGEIVPKADRISVPDTDIVSTPSNLVRKYYSSDRDGVVPDEVKSASVAVKKLNWLRLKMATDNVPCCHGTSRMKIIDRFGKSNPEFFALKSDGSRCNTFTGAPSSRQGHLCFSNPGLRDVIYDECVARFKKGARFVDIMPNDAYPGCCCEGCQKLYNNNDKSDYATDLIWDYTCDIAKRLSAAGINGKVTQMAYHPFQKVPDFDIPDNVAVMVAVHGPWAWSNPRSMKSDRAKIEAWAKKTGGSVWIWAYPHKYGPTLITGIPDVAPRAWGEYYKAMDDLIFGTFAESETDRWSYHYLNYYVFSRVMWDGAKADVDAILDEHYRLMFGPAAAEMKEFYEILEEKWLKGITGNVAMTEIGPVATVPTEGDIWTRVYSDETRSRMDALLKTAASKVVEGSIEARRIAFFRREYYSDFEKGYAEWRERADRVAAQRWDPNSGEKLSLVWYAGDKKSPERVKTTVAASRDGDDLVFTFDCEEPRMDELVAVVRERDDPDAWKDSGVEVFLNPSGDRKHYFHVIVNERGSLFDTADLKPGRSMWGGTHDRNWSPNLSAKVTERADGWTTVLRIPISALGEMQDAFPVEFLRSRMTKTGSGMGYYKWGTISDVLNDLECFGTMVVPKDRGDAAKVVFRPGSTEVVMDKGDCHVVKFAASEMTNFLSRAFGVPVPVVTSRTPGRKAILLGRAAAKAAGIDAKSLAGDEFVVRTVGSDAVAIVGRDHPSRDPAKEHRRGLGCNFDRATLHGVYAFLEKCAGCRFYFPGELGECVPRISEMSCEGFGWAERPAYQIRHWYDGNHLTWYGVSDPDELSRLRGLNMLRLRMETDPIPCCHGQNAFRYVERFGKSHPEYFMKFADGTRFNKGNTPGCSKFGQICYSSGAMEELYQDVKAYLTGKPASSRGLKNWGYNCSGGKYVDIMANDAFVRCQCGKCEKRAIDDVNNYATEMVWEEVAKIANRLAAEGVKGYVTQMAYWPYRSVPSIDIPTNVLVMVAETGPWTINDAKQLKRDNDEIAAWHSKLGRPVWIWTYPGKFDFQPYPGIPHSTPRAVAKYYKMVSKDIFGTLMNTTTDRYLYNHLNYYMLSRVAWDPSFDIDATLDEYYTLMYGPGAEVARGFLESLEEKWLRGVVGNIIETNIGPQAIQPPDSDLWTKTYSKEYLAHWRSRLEPFAVGDSLESRRVKMLLEEFLAPLESQSAAFFDRQAKVAALFYSTGGSPMKARPYRLAKGSAGEVETEVTIARDGGDIVVSYRCFEPNMSNTKCAVFGRNGTGQIWRNNSVEIFLNPSCDRKTYYHLIVSEKGEYDTLRELQLGNGCRQPNHDRSWQPELKVKPGVFEGGYTLEVRVPVESLGGNVPDEFFANFCRNRVLDDGVTFDLYSWSPYISGYHDPLDFGTVRLRTVFRPGSTEVVMDKGDCHVVKFAAVEMTNFLSRAFGAPVPVVTSRTPGCKAILLGKAAAKAAGIDVKSLAVDEFVVRTVGSDAVAIVGRDHPSRDPAREHIRGLACNFDRATLHGVYAFLEKCAGCRFYFPGELGECVPRIAEFSCEGFGWTERPAYQIRHWYDGNGSKWYGVDDPKELNRLRGLNMLRLRMETDPIPCCHGQNAFRYVERFGTSHPEYFMKLADGTRFNKGGAPGCSKFGQICYSSGAMEELYQDVKAYLTGKPASSRGLKNWGYNCSGGKYVDIMANDAFVRCQCGKCEPRSIADEANYATEMVWEEVVKIANRLTAEGVKGYVTQMAYCPYRKVPSIDIPTNVLVMVAETGPWTINDKKRLERDNAEIKAWHDKLGRPVWIWTYPGKYAVQSYPGIPHNTPRAIANYYKMVSKDIFGTFMESETDRYLFSHLNYYMLSRVAWDPSFDVDATLDEYYTLMYGAGAGAAKEFLEALEEKWLRGIVGNIIETNLGPQVIQPPDADIWNRTYTKECLAGWRSRLEPFAVGDSIESRRVKMLLEEFLSPLEKQSAAFLDRQAKVAALVYSTGGAPMEIVPFRMAKGSVGEVKTEATIARDGDAIVVGYRCFEPHMADTKCIVFGKNRTGQMWRNNGIEIYLNPSRDRKHYYHIVMSEKGEYDTFRVEQLGNGRRQPKHDSSWKPDLTVKTGVFDGGYTLEVRIPVAAFGEDIPDEFFANFCRNRILNDNVTFDLYSWSPYVTGYHDPLDFGTVRLK